MTSVLNLITISGCWDGAPRRAGRGCPDSKKSAYKPQLLWYVSPLLQSMYLVRVFQMSLSWKGFSFSSQQHFYVIWVGNDKQPIIIHACTYFPTEISVGLVVIFTNNYPPFAMGIQSLKANLDHYLSFGGSTCRSRGYILCGLQLRV